MEAATENSACRCVKCASRRWSSSLEHAPLIARHQLHFATTCSSSRAPSGSPAPVTTVSVSHSSVNEKHHALHDERGIRGRAATGHGRTAKGWPGQRRRRAASAVRDEDAVHVRAVQRQHARPAGAAHAAGVLHLVAPRRPVAALLQHGPLAPATGARCKGRILPGRSYRVSTLRTARLLFRLYKKKTHCSYRH